MSHVSFVDRQPLAAGLASVLTIALAASLYPSAAVAQKARPAFERSERAPSGPMIAIVSIADQSMQVFDNQGRIARTRISSGKPGHRTPTGVFSVIQKKVQHTSNIYFAEMPFMQRITWSGIALHAGVVPGYPASAGCIRLPIAFAREFYRMTDMGTRVIVAPEEVAPVEIAHPALFSPRPIDLEPLMARIGPRDGQAMIARLASADTNSIVPASEQRRRPPMPGAMRLGVPAAVDAAPAPRSAPAMPITPQADETAAATLPALRQQARQAVATATRIAQAERRAAEDVRSRNGRLVSEFAGLERSAVRAAARLEGAQQAFSRARTVRAIDAAIAAERRAAEQLASAAGELDDIGANAKVARGEIAAAMDKLKAAEAARADAQALVAELDRMMKPVHVMVSLKTSKIYVRQGHDPIIEAPVEFSGGARPIGTHVFTAITATEDSATWSVVSVAQKEVVREQRRARRAGVEAAAQDRLDLPSDATAALDRITIPEHIRQRISEMLTPGSSLIVSDEAPSSETGQGTDIIVVTR